MDAGTAHTDGKDPQSERPESSRCDRQIPRDIKLSKFFNLYFNTGDFHSMEPYIISEKLNVYIILFKFSFIFRMFLLNK
jgi:hypothetical protein